MEQVDQAVVSGSSFSQPSERPLLPGDSADVAPKRRFELLAVALAVVLLKLVFWWLDSDVRLFLGDSASYFHSALTGWMPPDRSFVYPLLVKITAVAAHSLQALLAAQTVFGVASALLLYLLLRRLLAVRFALAAAAALLVAVEPAQLFYERMIMAEASAGLVFIGFVWLCALYARSGGLAWIPLYVGLGLLALSLRLSIAPVVLTLGVLAPLVRLWLQLRSGDATRRSWSSAVLALLLCLFCTAIFHGQYTAYVGAQLGTRAGYLGNEGMMRLGLVAPLVKPEHLRRAGVDPRLLHELSHDLANHRAREPHIWMEGGLYQVLSRHVDDAERVAGKISIRAARDDPFGLVRMGWLTSLDYFDPSVVRHRINDDLATRPYPDRLLAEVRTATGTEIAHLPEQPGLVSNLFRHSTPWLTLCFLAAAPLALSLLWLQRGVAPDRFSTVIILVLTSLGVVANQFLFSHIVSFRYLHLFPWLVLAGAALALESLLQLRAARRVNKATLAQTQPAASH